MREVAQILYQLFAATLRGYNLSEVFMVLALETLEADKNRARYSSNGNSPAISSTNSGSGASGIGGSASSGGASAPTVVVVNAAPGEGFDISRWWYALACPCSATRITTLRLFNAYYTMMTRALRQKQNDLLNAKVYEMSRGEACKVFKCLAPYSVSVEE